MAKTNAERQAVFRQRRASRYVTGDSPIILGLKAEIESLRNEVAALRNEMAALRNSPLHPPYLNPSDDRVIQGKERKKPPMGVKKERNLPRRPSLQEWEPGEKHYRLAAEHGLTEEWVPAEAERYRDWNKNAKHPHKDYDAGFSNWIRYQPTVIANGLRNINGSNNTAAGPYLTAKEQASKRLDEALVREALKRMPNSDVSGFSSSNFSATQIISDNLWKSHRF